MTDTQWIEAGTVKAGLDALRKAEAEGIDSLGPLEVKAAYCCLQRVRFTYEDTRTRLESGMASKSALGVTYRELMNAYRFPVPSSFLEFRQLLINAGVPNRDHGFFLQDGDSIWPGRFVKGFCLHFDAEAFLDLTRQVHFLLDTPYRCRRRIEDVAEMDRDYIDYHPLIATRLGDTEDLYDRFMADIRADLKHAAFDAGELPTRRWEVTSRTEPVRSKAELRGWLSAILDSLDPASDLCQKIWLEPLHVELRNARRALRCFRVQSEVRDSPESLLEAERELERLIDLLSPEVSAGQADKSLQPEPKPKPKRAGSREVTQKERLEALDLAGIAILEEWHFSKGEFTNEAAITYRVMGKRLCEAEPKHTRDKEPRSVATTFFDRVFKQTDGRGTGHSRYRQMLEAGGTALRVHLDLATGNLADAYSGLMEVAGKALADSQPVASEPDDGPHCSECGEPCTAGEIEYYGECRACSLSEN
ncbi:MAG: hypothetical protein NXI04_01620 [Planctomycetaceae bacterium]|nr:hypothetical protein [Planctomycetaceae bacterium]